MMYRLVGTAWGLIVTAVLVLLPLSLRDRLPEPLATHWNDGPDRSTAFTAHLVGTLLLWLVPWAILMGVVLHGRMLERRLSRVYWWSFLVGIGVLVVGMELGTLTANLDRASWTQAELSGWAVVAALAAAAATGALAGFLGRGAPDQPSPAGENVPALRLRPGQRSVWVSRVSNRWQIGLVVASGVPLVAIVDLGLLGGVPIGVWVTLALVSAIALAFGLLLSSVTVAVTDDGLAIGFGPFGWPVRRIRLSKIDSAWSEQRFPSQVGGWGLRGLPGSAAIMLRGGECLVIRYRSGGQLVISIDDAERGASLINALIEGRAA